MTPDEVVDIYGADALRVAVMFIGPFEQDVAWNPAVAAGAARFVRRLYRLLTQPSKQGVGSRASGVATQRHDVRLRLHQLIKSAGDAIEKFRFNTPISELMTFLNDVEALEPQFTGTALWDEMTDTLVRICAPVTPFVAEDAWHALG